MYFCFPFKFLYATSIPCLISSELVHLYLYSTQYAKGFITSGCSFIKIFKETAMLSRGHMDTDYKYCFLSTRNVPCGPHQS